jgi:hypothetical protein
MAQIFRANLLILLMVSFAFVLAGCETGLKREAKYPTGGDRPASGGDIYAKPDTIWGKGKSLLDRGEDEDEDGSSGVTVNSYLWRASLDTVSFMPLASADPFGGVILTDWYTAPETPDERYKVNVFILGKQLRSDGVRVRIFKQVAYKGAWQDAEVGNETARQLEDTILTRARQLRSAANED